MFWLLFKSHDTPIMAVSKYEGCNENASASYRQIEYFPMGESFNSTSFYNLINAIVCSMYLTDQSNGKLEDPEFYTEAQSVMIETWQGILASNNAPKEKLAIEYLKSIATSELLSQYKPVSDAIFGMLQFTYARWGYSAEKEFSEVFQRGGNPLNQAISSASRYNRLARRTFFLRPQFNRKNTIILMAGLSIFALSLFVRNRRRK